MAEKEKQEALLSENNYRLLDEIRRQQTADFREGGALLPQGSSFCFSGM